MLFHWLSVLPYANKACASLQTLALVGICIISTFAGGKVGRERERKRERGLKEFGIEKKEWKSLTKHRRAVRWPFPANISAIQGKCVSALRVLYVLTRLIRANSVIFDMMCTNNMCTKVKHKFVLHFCVCLCCSFVCVCLCVVYNMDLSSISFPQTKPFSRDQRACL